MAVSQYAVCLNTGTWQFVTAPNGYSISGASPSGGGERYVFNNAGALVTVDNVVTVQPYFNNDPTQGQEAVAGPEIGL